MAIKRRRKHTSNVKLTRHGVSGLTPADSEIAPSPVIQEPGASDSDVLAEVP